MTTAGLCVGSVPGFRACVESAVGSDSRREEKESPGPTRLISSWHAITLCRNYRFENGSADAGASGGGSS